MDKFKIQNIIEIIDKEIKAYEGLKQLFEEKKELLKKSKAGDIGEVDNRIISQGNVIEKINDVRKQLTIEEFGKDLTMTQYTEYLSEKYEAYKDELEKRKVKICKLSEELVLLNNQNVELLKHGIVMTNKMLETIVDAFAPQGSNYNDTGKADTHDLDMWTVNEEI
ncbi:MAG: flagellar export chaperone FlgN [bacterium]|nr:flagellar export chaperone FlgN [bacterium]